MIVLQRIDRVRARSFVLLILGGFLPDFSINRNVGPIAGFLAVAARIFRLFQGDWERVSVYVIFIRVRNSA